MKPIAAYLIAVAFIVYWADAIFSSEITVYKAFCDGKRTNDVCVGKEEAAARTTYKVYASEQSVVYWTEAGPPSRFGRCAVRNVKNWTCQYEASNEVDPALVYVMLDGEYSERVKAPANPSTNLFYPIPAWRWWIARANTKWL